MERDPQESRFFARDCFLLSKRPWVNGQIHVSMVSNTQPTVHSLTHHVEKIPHTHTQTNKIRFEVASMQITQKRHLSNTVVVVGFLFPLSPLKKIIIFFPSFLSCVTVCHSDSGIIPLNSFLSFPFFFSFFSPLLY